MESSGNEQQVVPLPIVEDDQQLYDWGIEHRLDQYYGNTEQQFQYPHQHPPKGYVLPEHVQQQENAYLVTVTDDQNPSKTMLPVNPLPQSHVVVKTEKRTYRHPNIKPNGVPGRRPILPTVDMDANELLKASD